MLLPLGQFFSISRMLCQPPWLFFSFLSLTDYYLSFKIHFLKTYFLVNQIFSEPPDLSYMPLWVLKELCAYLNDSHYRTLLFCDITGLHMSLSLHGTKDS